MATDHTRGTGRENPDEGRRSDGGFGDEGGTRVGRPATGPEGTGPSSQPVKEGLEGAIFEDDETSGGSRGGGPGNTSRGKSTGAGGEAAEGLHAAKGRPQGDETATHQRESEQREGGDSTLGGNDRLGSEPLHGRTTEHKGSYGGEGAEPRVSSDQRERNER